jgi:hypothetical protein
MGGTSPLEFVPNVRCGVLWDVVLTSCCCHSFSSLDCSDEPVFLRRVVLSTRRHSEVYKLVCANGTTRFVDAASTCSVELAVTFGNREYRIEHLCS